MFNVCVVGAGKIGVSIAKLLCRSGDYRVTVIDRQRAALQALAGEKGVHTLCLDTREPEPLVSLFKQQGAVISSSSFTESVVLANCALAAGASYFDLTEDNRCTAAIMPLADKAGPGQVFVPQCGLAPGFVSILAHHVFQQFDEVDSLKLRVGALPEFSTNQLMYNLTWSTDGLINEFCNPCQAIRGSQRVDLMPLEGLEIFALDGVEYEAFNTSGGLGTLCETLHGRLRELDYKTVRYPGHQYLMDFLINGLKLGQRRSLLRKIFENAVAVTDQDLVLIMVSATGRVGKQFTQITDSRKIYNTVVDGEHWSSIQLTTAASVCAVLDIFVDKVLALQGFVKQEQIPLAAFLANRFGQYYNKRHSRREVNHETT